MPKIVGVYEIADLLGVTRQRVQQLIKHADFPAPAVTLRSGPIWLLTDVQDWAKRTGRTLRNI